MMAQHVRKSELKKILIAAVLRETAGKIRKRQAHSGYSIIFLVPAFTTFGEIRRPSAKEVSDLVASPLALRQAGAKDGLVSTRTSGMSFVCLCVSVYAKRVYVCICVNVRMCLSVFV